MSAFAGTMIRAQSVRAKATSILVIDIPLFRAPFEWRVRNHYIKSGQKMILVGLPGGADDVLGEPK
jgi:hypothetical protein